MSYISVNHLSRETKKKEMCILCVCVVLCCLVQNSQTIDQLWSVFLSLKVRLILFPLYGDMYSEKTRIITRDIVTPY